jgi:CubicO group peptidase (beta-lactamase class C family)
VSDLSHLNPSLDDAIRETMAHYGVPGAAVAIVRDGEPYVGCYGVRRLSAPDPVTPRTAFNVASTSKAFTAAVVAALTDRGIANWDDPVRKWAPEFETPDPWISDHMTLRDLSANRSGLPRTGVCEFGTELSIPVEEVIRRLKYVEPLHRFRQRFTYSNIGHTAVALSAARAYGSTYLQALREFIFEPLGMTESSCGAAARTELKEQAGWHCSVGGRTLEIDPIYTDVHMGTAGMCVSAQDATRWLRLLLSDGSVDGKRVLSKAALNELLTPQTIIRPEELAIWIGPPEAKFAGYCLGWACSEQSGYKVIRHSGSDFGVNAHIVLVPEAGIGIAAYINKDCKASIEITYRALDALLSLPPRDWTRIINDRTLPDTNASFKHSPIAPPAPTPLDGVQARYVGAYFHPANGPVYVQQNAEGALELRFVDAAVFDSELRPLGGNRFLTVPFYPGLGSDAVGGRFEAEFHVCSRGVAERLAIAGIGDFERRES